MRVSIHVKSASGNRKRSPATHGIQGSGTPHASSAAPTDLTTPSATMKLAQSPAASASV